MRFGVCDFLRGRGFAVEEAETCRQAEAAFRKAPPAVAIVDYSLPDGNALELLPRLKEVDPSVPVVILTAHGSIDLAVRAIKEGAEQFLTKPVQLEALAVILERLIENQRNRQQQLARRTRLAPRAARPFLGDERGDPGARGRGAPRRRSRTARSSSRARRAPARASSRAGSTRTGPRAEEAFVDLNCAGLSREFLETELFGHEKGAFTGAIAAKPGLLEVAHRGTIFLDEIGDVDAQVQPKLLKVARGETVPPDRRRPRPARGHPPADRDAPEPARSSSARSASAATSTSASAPFPCACRRCASARRTCRSLAEQILEGARGALGPREDHARARTRRRRSRAYCVARQHPRAAQRARARGAAVGRPSARPDATCASKRRSRPRRRTISTGP